jgi:ribosomal protein S18 acetylase RimI-like enzyme
VQQPPVDRASSDGIVLDWRGPLDDAEMVDLTRSHGGRPAAGWWERIQPHSFGWVTARDASGMLVGFVNVVSDGDCHAFLVDTKTRGSFQHRGIGKRVVAFAAEQAQAAGHEWLHVDFDDDLAPFYFDACGFEPTPAGLIRLT